MMKYTLEQIISHVKTSVEKSNNNMSTSFAYNDEHIYEHASELVKIKEKNKMGLKGAIDDFLSNNQNWIVKEVYTNCNGLTVLERKF